MRHHITQQVGLVVAMLAVTALLAPTRAKTAVDRRLRQVHHRDAGLGTLEIVVIALGLFLLAGLLVAAVTAAVNGRLSQIQ